MRGAGEGERKGNDDARESVLDRRKIGETRRDREGNAKQASAHNAKRKGGKGGGSRWPAKY